MSYHAASSARSNARAQRRLALHGAHKRNAAQHASARSKRAQIIAQLIAASQALAAEPDAATLLLDGALSQMLDHWARRARIHLADKRHALNILEEHAPAIAWRLRMALQAQNPEARLAHCWALLDLLTTPTTSTRRDNTPAAHSRHANTLPLEGRKDTQSHVS